MAIEKLSGLAAYGPKEELRKIEVAADPLADDEVYVRVTHCGLCHSDLHLVDNDWGWSRFPLIPGHEVVGTVEQLGRAVTRLRLGERVGIGWQSASCGHCEYCESAQENLCADQEATCVGRHGGFADHVKVKARFAFPIPDGLSSEAAAPLLCAGITVFSPLLHVGVRPGDRVGVFGVGGLGHLALQFARAMGCEVTAFSGSQAKSEDARQFGAHHFVSTGEDGWDKRQRRSLDFLLFTATGKPPLSWDRYLDILRPKGRLCLTGVPEGELTLSPMPLIGEMKSISGSPIGDCTTMRQMLHFAALHQVQPKVEVFAFNDANRAIEKLRANVLRYRAVLRR